MCNQIESDFPGVIVTPSSGLSTANGGSPITFTVQLTTIPSAAVTIPLSVGIPQGGTTEATVTGPGGTAQLAFTAGSGGNWNVPQTVTVTPLSIDTATTYVTSYEIDLGPVSSTDVNYSGISIPPVPIFEGTSTPPLKAVWGKCGLLGLELGLPWGIFALWRRKQRRAREQRPGASP
jgi:hypothetical protein